MDLIFPNGAGLDVHKKFVTACRRSVDVRGRVHPETRTFGTMTSDIDGLRAWLLDAGCTHVAMERTSVYWLPVYNLLEDHVEVSLVNAQHVKRVPGRKTDVSDAAWLAQLLQHGLLKPSFNTANSLYGKERFRYDSERDCYVCPAGQALPFHFETTEEGRRIRYYWTMACNTCPVRSHCTRTREYRGLNGGLTRHTLRPWRSTWQPSRTSSPNEKHSWSIHLGRSSSGGIRVTV
jgi:hypothetical protein